MGSIKINAIKINERYEELFYGGAIHIKVLKKETPTLLKKFLNCGLYLSPLCERMIEPQPWSERLDIIPDADHLYFGVGYINARDGAKEIYLMSNDIDQSIRAGKLIYEYYEYNEGDFFVKAIDISDKPADNTIKHTELMFKIRNIYIKALDADKFIIKARDIAKTNDRTLFINTDDDTKLRIDCNEQTMDICKKAIRDQYIKGAKESAMEAIEEICELANRLDKVTKIDIHED